MTMAAPQSSATTQVTRERPALGIGWREVTGSVTRATEEVDTRSLDFRHDRAGVHNQVLD